MPPQKSPKKFVPQCSRGGAYNARLAKFAHWPRVRTRHLYETPFLNLNLSPPNTHFSFSQNVAEEAHILHDLQNLHIDPECAQDIYQTLLLNLNVSPPNTHFFYFLKCSRGGTYTVRPAKLAHWPRVRLTHLSNTIIKPKFVPTKHSLFLFFKM